MKKNPTIVPRSEKQDHTFNSSRYVHIPVLIVRKQICIMAVTATLSRKGKSLAFLQLVTSVQKHFSQKI